MADPISGKNAYVYIGGTGLIHLTGWDYNYDAGYFELEPDIATSRKVNVVGFASESGNIDFNLTSDDYAAVHAAVVSPSAVMLYLYTATTGSLRQYLYGSALLGSENVTVTLLGTIKGKVSYRNSNSTGFTRANY